VEEGIHGGAEIEGSQPPEIIELAGLGVVSPTTVISRDRLVFVKELYDADI